jgi:chromosomal replication initiation ATPase DnaA
MTRFQSMMSKHFGVLPSEHGFIQEGRRTVAIIAALTGVPRTKILGKDRSRVVFEARQRICVELRHKGWSFGRIAALLNRHHTSIIDAVRSAQG